MSLDTVVEQIDAEASQVEQLAQSLESIDAQVEEIHKEIKLLREQGELSNNGEARIVESLEKIKAARQRANDAAARIPTDDPDAEQPSKDAETGGGSEGGTSEI